MFKKKCLKNNTMAPCPKYYGNCIVPIQTIYGKSTEKKTNKHNNTTIPCPKYHGTTLKKEPKGTVF